MSRFSLPRFTRVIQNDALRIARPLLYGTVALLGLAVLIYLTNFDGHVEEPTINEVLFAIYLLGGGLLFTSTGFQDMHHPLERYQCLMMPCSNLERFLSRYLLTGPLFLLYVIATFSAMDWVGNQLTQRWLDASEPLFSSFTADSLLIIRVWLALHAVMLTSFQAVKPLQLWLLPLFAASWLNCVVATGFVLWILYIACRCLKAHEVQDGI